MTLEPAPLSDAETQSLVRLLENPRNAAGRDLLAFSGANTAAGLLTRLMAMDPHDRAVLLTAIRKVIATDQV